MRDTLNSSRVGVVYLSTPSAQSVIGAMKSSSTKSTTNDRQGSELLSV